MLTIKKALRFLFSMKFALIILCLFVLVCVAGSVIPQGEIQAVYENSYPGWSGLILGTGLDDVFHSWWFIALTLLLCGNLLGCNLLHISPILRKMKRKTRSLPAGEEGMAFTGEPDELLKELGFSKWEDTEGGRYAIRNRIGYWGAWLTHLGILIIIVGFALGQMFTVNYTVYGVPGEEKPIADTGLTLTIDDFSIDLRPDDTVEQYTADLTLTDPASGESWSGQASVNHPWDAHGLRFYQNSTGWAADMTVYQGDTLLQTDTLCAGEYRAVKEKPELLVMLRAFYPDYVQDEAGMPATASADMKNPGYLYMLYYNGELLGMNVLRPDEKITVSDYTILFSNPRSYTLIQIKHDPFTWLAGLGGVVLLAALVVAFYLRTEEVWLVEQGKGWLVYGYSRKGSELFREKLARKIKEGTK